MGIYRSSRGRGWPWMYVFSSLFLCNDHPLYRSAIKGLVVLGGARQADHEDSLFSVE
jgi:hypothetical protein